eukprot:gene17243-biopygen15882
MDSLWAVWAAWPHPTDTCTRPCAKCTQRDQKMQLSQLFPHQTSTEGASGTCSACPATKIELALKASPLPVHWTPSPQPGNRFPGFPCESKGGSWLVPKRGLALRHPACFDMDGPSLLARDLSTYGLCGHRTSSQTP